VGTVETYRGPVAADRLGVTLTHEHIFVRNPELEVNLPDGEWDPAQAVETAVTGLTDLYAHGVRTVVDLTVPGLGRDVGLIAQVAERVPVNLVAATGWYTPNALPPFFRHRGPGLQIDTADPLVELFSRDIREGISGSGVRAAIIKVVTDAEGLTTDVSRVLSAAALAHEATGVAITTHSHPASHNGLEQQRFLVERGVAPDRMIIGHSGDTEDLEYLGTLMDEGSTIGMDRFGMEHVLSDERRVRTVAALVDLGYSDRMLLSHDAAFYSHVTPPSWRAANAPAWRMDTIVQRIIPMLDEVGVSPDDVDQMMVVNPSRLLEPS
jgi:phosphotriesterase-related protein